ncbi:MAG: hypothetical protein WC376_04075 [Candidatus Nanoarchaeia archaeon]|jgi:hypothetical protein
MNNAFIRSVEAVMAILLFFSFYSIKTQDYETKANSYDPSRQMIGIMDSLESNNALSDYVQRNDLKGISDIISYFMPPLTGFKIESSCLEEINVKSSNNFQTTANISFLKFFPKTANIQSIEVIDAGNNFLPVSIKNNFYISKLSIIANDELINQTINLDNVRIVVDESESINSSSMHFFINSEPVPMSFESIDYNAEPYDANVSIKILVPYMEKGSVAQGALFYQANETSFIQDYISLGLGLNIEYYSSPSEKSNACEVTFSDTLNPNDEKNYGLYYELNTNTQNQYVSLLANYSGIEVDAVSTYYDADISLKTYEAQSYYSIKSSYVLDRKNCMITLKVWNYE